METDNKYPTRYRIEFIEQGIINYEDVNQGRVFVSNEALDRMKPSYIGKPIINEVHQDMSAEQAFKLTDEEKDAMADGVVYDCGKLDNGWYYVDCIIWDLETKENIKSGYSASCAYMPTKTKDGGVWHGFDYNDEIEDGVYTHMAIVKNPRYEKATIYELPATYENSIPENVLKIYKNCRETKAMENKPKKRLFNFLWNEKPKDEELEVEKINADGDSSVVVIDGQEVPLKELIDTYLAEQAEIAQKAELEKQASLNTIKPEDEVDIGEGKKVTAQELISCYQKNAAKINSEEEDKKAKEEEEKKNALENSKPNDNFKALENAVNKSVDGISIMIQTRADKIAAGKKKYGSEGDKK